jgi:hypothetical protein
MGSRARWRFEQASLEKQQQMTDGIDDGHPGSEAPARTLTSDPREAMRLQLESLVATLTSINEGIAAIVQDLKRPNWPSGPNSPGA